EGSHPHGVPRAVRPAPRGRPPEAGDRRRLPAGRGRRGARLHAREPQHRQDRPRGQAGRSGRGRRRCGARLTGVVDGEVLEVPEAEPFTALASVYDDIMAEVEYDEWCEFILDLARARGYRDGPLHDLACGTGNATLPMRQRGLPVSGSDASSAMLAVARAKLPGVELTRA